MINAERQEISNLKFSTLGVYRITWLIINEFILFQIFNYILECTLQIALFRILIKYFNVLQII